MKYVDYIMDTTEKLLAIPSPSGFTSAAAGFVAGEFKKMGYVPVITNKGAVLVDLSKRTGELETTENVVGKKIIKDSVLLAAHMDTLGAMVTEIKSNGRLKLTNVGGLNPNNTEAENCTVYTRTGQVYDATFQLIDASIHVNSDYDDTKRNYKTMEAILDEIVSSKEDVEELGIMNGDFVCFDPRTVITKSGYIKSRFLDDKFSTGILMGLAKYIKDENIKLKRNIYILITSYEEVGHGGCTSIPEDVVEMISVDMGCVGEGLRCDETMVSICAKDSRGPYDYEVTTALINAAKEHGIKFAVDVYPHYGSDVDAALMAGHDVKHGLIGPGVYASHGYERSHRLGAKNTFELLKVYLCEKTGN